MTYKLLAVNNISKKYVGYSSDLHRFAKWLGFPPPYSSEYWAIKEISFSIGPGEVLAIIGGNGAGKSSLLKLIAGVVRPSSGKIEVNGSISAILELGLGFNPELTGRQNAYLAGGLMGLSQKALDHLMDGIEDFSEIGTFFDQPLRVYSSGMQARLAFSLATAVRPDLLIIDEVLSVGDSYFQHKSFGRIMEFKKQGTSMLLVTHSLSDVRALANRVILLDSGEVLKDGMPDEVVDYYNALIAEKENLKLTIEQRRKKDGWLMTKSGSMECKISSVELCDAECEDNVQIALVGQELKLLLTIEVLKDIPSLVIGFMLRDRQGNIVWGTNTWHTKQRLENLIVGQIIQCQLNFNCTLGPGAYAFTFSLCRLDSHISGNYEWTDNALVFDVMNSGKNLFIGSNYIENKISFEGRKI